MSIPEDKISNTPEFIRQAIALHKDTYDYTKTIYDKSKKKCTITCKLHGDFEQTPASHMSGSGCPACAETKGEKRVRAFLEKHGINYETQKTFDDLVYRYPLRYDFYLPDEKAVIEYHGIQHFESVKHFGGDEAFAERQERDGMKKQYAKDNSIGFLEIRYDDNTIFKLKEFLGIESFAIPNLFDRYANISGRDLPVPESLTPQEKYALTASLRMAGESMMAIAKYFGVSRQTAYNYFNKSKEERLSDLESKTYLDIFTDRLFELEEQRDIYRKTIERIRIGGEDQDEVDPRTGEVRPKTSHLRNISELGKLVLSYDKMIIDLEYAVGLIPKNNPEGIYGRLSDRNPNSEDVTKHLYEMNDEEISNVLLDKLMEKKSGSFGGNALKSIKNENIL